MFWAGDAFRRFVAARHSAGSGALTVALHGCLKRSFLRRWCCLRGARRLALQVGAPATNLSPLYQSVLYFTASVTILQVFWGGLASGSEASMACTGLPACNGSYAWPEFMLSQIYYTIER